jgi:ribosomal protein S18 acetylase RimI-like enzyme
MARLDLPWLMRTEGHESAPPWTRQGFLAALQAGGGAVAEVNGQPVGFVVYQVTPPPDGTRPAALKRLLRRWVPWGHATCVPPRQVDLLHVVVLPPWHRQGIGRALLEHLHQAFGQAADHIQAVVPETNLAAQLLLRDAGYKAVRVVRGCLGGEDSYVMERTGAAAGL